MKKFYIPIDVAAYYSVKDSTRSLWLDPVQIINWEPSNMTGSGAGTALEEGEVERFANPMAANPIGGVELLVGSEVGQTAGEVLALLESDEDDKRTHIITIGTPGSIPAIWSAPVSVSWMRELKKITLGYPGFYGGGDTPEGGTMPEWWTVNPVNQSYIYDFMGDRPDYDDDGNLKPIPNLP
jgi:hypothetical protein